MKIGKRIALFSALVLVVGLLVCLACACSTVTIYSVKFSVDGQIVSTVSTAGTELKLPPDPTPATEEFEFAGWYYDNGTFNNPFNAEALQMVPLNASTTLYAKWNKLVTTYTVLFLNYDGSVLDTQTVVKGSSATAPDVRAREGYEFTGWSGSFSSVNSDLEIRTLYSPETFIVTFVDYNEKVISTDEVEKNGMATAPSLVDRTGYEFIGWSTGFDRVTSNLKVKAQYRIKTYDVTFRDEFGNVLKTEKVNYGGNAVPPVIPLEKEGYIFSEWSGSYLSVTSNVNLTAIYNVKNFTVNFIDTDGTLIVAKNADYGSSVIAPVVATAPEGYEFIGWDKDLSYIKQDMTVTACYKLSSFVVTFKGYDNVDIAKQSVNYGVSATAPEVTAPAGYEFSGWDGDFTNVKRTLTIRAQFVRSRYAVRFLNYDGSLIGDLQQIFYGEAATAPDTASLSRTGYTYREWDKAFDTITADTDVYALYDKNVYTVTFKDKSGALLSEQQIPFGEDAVPPATTDDEYNGYAHTGWSKSYQSISENVTIIAEYTPKTYILTEFWYQENQQLFGKTSGVKYGSSVSLTALPVRTGYTFEGWFADDNYLTAFDNDTMPADNTTYYAKWKEHTYNLSFEVGLGAENTNADQNGIGYAQTITLPAEDTVGKIGYNFGNWNTKADGTGTAYAAGATVSRLAASDAETVTLYAVFVPKVFDITLLGHNDVVFKELQLSYGSTYTVPEIGPENKYGWHFIGWTLNPTTGALMNNPNYTVSNSVNIYAVYEIDRFTVSFLDYDGNVIDGYVFEDVEHGSSLTPPDAPDPGAGYEFNAWDGDYSCVISDMNIRATRTQLSYGVKFFDWNGSQIGNTQYLHYGLAAEAPAVNPQTKLGWHFFGWDKAFDSVTEELDVTAVYAINTYSVTFKDEDGEILSTDTVDYGSGATAPEAPTAHKMINYRLSHFSAWDKDFDSVTADLIVTAVYAVDTYTVTFKDYLGNQIGTAQTVRYGDHATAPLSVAERTGYTFDKWLGNVNVPDETPAVAYTTAYRIYCDVEFEAVYKINSFTVQVYDTDDMSDYKLKSSFTADYGSDASLNASFPSAPKGLLSQELSAQYHFVRWGLKGGAEYNYSFVTEDIRLYAYYVKNSVNVTFYNTADPTMSAESYFVYGDIQTLNYGDSATAPTIPDSIEHYHFNGWSRDFTNVQENIKVFATYAIDTYTVSFYDGDSLMAAVTTAYGAAAVAPDTDKAPSDTLVYTFNGWDKSFDNITQDISVYADYTAATRYYVASYYNSDGSELTDLRESLTYNATLSAPANPSVADVPAFTYAFAYWTEESSDEHYTATDIAALKAVANRKFTAVYNAVPRTYEIVFQNWDGTEISRAAQNYNTRIAVPISPSKEEDNSYKYSFIGWTEVGGDGTVLTVSETANLRVQYAVTFKAAYSSTVKLYTIIFRDFNNAVITSVKVGYGTDIDTVIPNAPVKPSNGIYDYVFSGWSPTPVDVIGDASYLANYQSTLRKFDVRFLDYDGTVLQTEKVEYGSSAEYKGATPDGKVGHTFSGWDKSLDNVTDDMDVTALYTPNKQTLTFVISGAVSTRSVNYGTVYNYSQTNNSFPSVSTSDSMDGWLVAGSNTLLISGQSHVVKGDETFTALIRSYTAVIGNTGYSTLNKALTALTSGATLVVKQNAIFDQYVTGGTYNVVSGATLNIPYSAASGDITADGGTSSTEAGAAYLYTSLTVPENVTVKVFGTLQVGGVLNYAGGGVQGHTSGNHSEIVNNGTITVENGGKINCYGFIKGSGTVDVKSGGSVYEPYVVNDYRGGTITTMTYRKGDIAPYRQYSVNNVRCTLKINAGGNEYGWASLFASNKYNKTTTNLIGSNGIIRITSGYMLRTCAAKEIFIDLYGTGSDGALELTISGVTISTGDLFAAIPWNYNINVCSGSWTMGCKYKLMTGAAITVKNGATLNVSGSLIGYQEFNGDYWASSGGANEYNSRVYPSNLPAAIIALNAGGTFKVTGSFGGVLTGNGGTANLTSAAALSLTSIEGFGNAKNAAMALANIGKFYTVATITEAARGYVGGTLTTLAKQVYTINN